MATGETIHLRSGEEEKVIEIMRKKKIGFRAAAELYVMERGREELPKRTYRKPGARKVESTDEGGTD